MTRKLSSRAAHGIELVWRGKRAPAAVPAPDLRVVERNGASADHAGSTDSAWTDKLVHAADTALFAALRDGPLAEEVARAGGVKLVYLDPPFGVGADFALDGAAWSGARGIAYRDRWNGAAEHVQWLYERLVLVHGVLADGGALYLHVDWRASAFAKCLLDEVFGPTSFRGWIVWRTGCGAKSRTRWSQEHQDILCYAKGARMTFRTRSKALRRPFARTSREMHFTHVGESGRKFRSRVVNGKEYVYFEDEGKLVGSVWDDVPAMAASSPILSESVGYPTQKPEKLLARILEASSERGDVVLDPCCGSGTTAVVAGKLGRKWIACDIGAAAVHATRKRVVASDGAAPFELLRTAGSAPRAGRIRAHLERRAGRVRVVLDDSERLDAWGVASSGDRAHGIRWTAMKRRPQDGLACQSDWFEAEGGHPISIIAVDERADEIEIALDP